MKLKATEYARQACELYNQYTNGDVYGCVYEIYDTNKNHMDYDAVWGYFGKEYVMEEWLEY